MNMLSKICGLLLLAIILLSCHETDRNRISRLVKEWEGKEIVFPAHIVFTIQGCDTVPYKIPKSNYKVVVFVDSVGCISCKLQLSKWKNFMHEVDSLCDVNVPFLFLFQTNDVRELKYIFRRENFMHPVCIDTEDIFNELNHFPNETMFQTFLIDSENRVKVIGNPIHNLTVKDLYLEILTRKESCFLPITKIKADSAEYHYGVIESNKTARKKITLINIGKEVFRIKGVTTSCDCMSTDYDWNEIPPGEKETMTIEYKAEELGDFWRTITIYGNVPERSLTLNFWGTVNLDK